MAKLTIIQWISREDLHGAPEWIDGLLNPLNQFMNSVNLALNRQLTYEDNFLSQSREFTIKAGATAADNKTSFPCTMKARPQYLELGYIAKNTANYSPIGQPVMVEWQYDGTNILITAISGLTEGQTYTLRVRIT